MEVGAAVGGAAVAAAAAAGEPGSETDCVNEQQQSTFNNFYFSIYNSLMFFLFCPPFISV
jgi:hypothetical protein